MIPALSLLLAQTAAPEAVTLKAGKMGTLDVVLFFLMVIGVTGFGIWKGTRKSKDATDGGAAGYFLAGRGLTWWLVGFSLISANISTEQFVGMSGAAADWLGMAIASYEWLAAIALVLVAFVFLPRLLRCGLYTIPEFLEYRYGVVSRTVMASLALLMLVCGPTATVIYSGAKVVSVFFQGVDVAGLNLGNVKIGCCLVGICAAINVFVGGLKAGTWTGMVWGAALIIGGAIVAGLAFGAMKDADPHQLIASKVMNSSATVEDLQKAGAWERFMLLNDGHDGEAAAITGENQSGGKLHMKLPKTDPDLPWTALIFGIWIPVIYYWGLNQFIVQRTLGSKSLAEGQKGIVLAAFLKLIIPFIVVVPGILCFNLYHQDLRAEAVKKNTNTMVELAKTDHTVYPFTEAFARMSPDQAKEVVTHNSRVVGVAMEAAPVDATPQYWATSNARLLQAAASQPAITTGAKLVGYDYDAAFPTLLRNLMRPGITWFVLAALFGAVISSLAAMLNSAATIATMDLYQKVKKDATQAQLVGAGRFFTILFVAIAILLSTILAERLSSIFRFIQEIQGFISPGILAIFLVGFLVPRAPRYLGWAGIALNAVLYALLMFLGDRICANGLWYADHMSFLDRMGICFICVLILCGVATLVHPLAEPAEMPVNDQIALESSNSAKLWGAVAIIATIALYVIFW
ncbi:hypothetical protein [Haloferula sp. BvORR071]|uniref:sodium:solute symporter family transporter n=1 Tax=Haloferula sp. BvORR071 TaxID=1396141 RepID=UPI00094634FE|nr:hypothetical protein [Haloferula sp. BvORR071]